MKCPHCGQNLAAGKCASCGSEIFEESLFCHRCGSKLEKLEAKPKTVEGEQLDFSQRILCSDGTCIGVVNEKGVCKVCGKPYTGDPA